MGAMGRMGGVLRAFSRSTLAICSDHCENQGVGAFVVFQRNGLRLKTGRRITLTRTGFEKTGLGKASELDRAKRVLGTMSGDGGRVTLGHFTNSYFLFRVWQLSGVWQCLTLFGRPAGAGQPPRVLSGCWSSFRCGASTRRRFFRVLLGYK